MGKLDLVLMGRAMFSQSLIQFSIDGEGCVPSLLFDLRPNFGGSNEDNGDLLQKVPSCTAALSAPNPAAGHCIPIPLLRLLDTHGRVWVSLLWGSLLLSPWSWCTQGFVCALQESIPQSCVNSGSSSSKRAYATPKSAAPRAPAPAAVHC